MDKLHAALIVAVAAGVTLVLRAAPFWLFGGRRGMPKIVTYLSETLPAAVMGMLVVYCLRHTELLGPTHGLPELIAVAAVAALHLWKKNTVLSIAGGTLVYMVLIQTVFA